MADRVETTLSYKLDARGLRDARQEFQKTFDPEAAKQLNAQMGQMEKQLGRLTREQVQLNTQMEGVKKGTEAYKTLERALGDVEKRLRSTRSAMSNLDAVGRRMPTPPSAPAPAPAPVGRTAFAAGVGGYLGARASSAAQRAGGVLGGGGPLTTATAGIPGIGGAAAMAEGAVGQFLQRRRAQLGLLPFMGGGAQLTGLREEADAAAEAEKVQRLRAFRMEVPKQFQRRRRHAPRDLAKEGFVRDALGTLSSEGQIPSMSSEEVADLMGPHGTPLGIDQLPEDIRFRVTKRAQDLRRRRGFSGAQKRARSARAAMRKAQQAELSGRREQARRDAIAGGLRTATGDVQAIGARMGLTDQESLQMATQMGRGTGGRFRADEFEQGLAGQAMGIGTQTTARLFRQQREGRAGTTQGVDALASAIGGAVALGLEGSDVEEHLSAMVSLQERAEQRGLKLSVEGVQTMAAALTGGGVAGLQAARIAGGFVQQAQGLAMGGPTGAEDIALLSAAGFRSGSGFGNYFSALQKAENVANDPEMLFDFMRNLTQGMNLGTAEGQQRAAFTLSRTRFGRESVGSLGQAQKLIGALQGGDVEAFRANLSVAGALRDGQLNLGALAPGGGAAGMAALAGVRGEGGGAGGDVMRMLMGPLRAQADITNRLTDVGGQVVSTVQGFQRASTTLASGVGELSTIFNRLLPVAVNVAESLETSFAFLAEQLGTKATTP